ncbi:CD4-specific ankyrin repeat protein D5.1 [Lactarius tabidus]
MHKLWNQLIRIQQNNFRYSTLAQAKQSSLSNRNTQPVNQLGGFHGTPLHASVVEGHIEISQLLFAHGADINSHCADNYTPLHHASMRGYLRISKWLLDHGADMAPKLENGYTPLHFAAKHGHLEVCQILLECNADINSLNNGSTTALHLASVSWQKGSAGIVQLLLDYGADVQICDLHGQTASVLAGGTK